MENAQGSQYNAGHGHNNASSYQYNNAQSDPFHSFIHTEDEGAFDNSWQTPDFSAHQQPNTAFDQNGHQWPHNSYQPPESSFLSIPQFNVEQRYSPNSSNFQYPSFNSNPSHEFGTRESFQQPTYSSAADFSTNSLSDGTPYQYSGARDFESNNQTISPAAIESHPNISGPSLDANRNTQPSQHFPASQGQLSIGDPRNNATPVPLSIQDWRQLATRSVKSIDRPGLHIKPTNQYASATQSKRFDGFIFVGNTNIAVDSSKATVPRYKRKKSRNETMRLLQNEKGEGSWHPDREPLVKKLKVAAKKQAGPRPAVTSTASRSSSPSESSESDSDDSSEDNSDTEPEREPEEQSPLPSARPTDPNKAVEYDLIKAIWAKRSAVLSSPVVRTALAETWDIFKGLRDKWKSKCTNLQQAIDKKDTTTEKAFERRVAEQRRLVESCINLTLKHGHPSIVEKLGENPVLLVIFYQLLADRVKYGEYAGTFVSSILQFMVRCPNIDNALLEQTKVDKILQRLLKKGDEQGKALTQKILQNAKIAEKRSGTATQINHISRKSSSEATRTSDTVVKRERQVEFKRPAGDLSSKGANGAATTKERLSSDDSKSVKTKTEATDTKTKIVNVAAKPSGFFSSLKSASKRPGTSTKSDDTNSSNASEKRSDAPAAASKPAFSFAATMAGLAKQKEEPPVRAEETRKPETADERQRRLRKEQRRKLRVSFKGDDELVSIRTFEHDPDEEIGHDQSQVRDVLDSKGEGQMLKMHKDLELDDDEDYEPPEEILPELSDWSTPQATDFSDIDESELSRNYTNRGGRTEVDSPERDVQKAREQDTLMAIYTSASDIPLTPREPVDAYAGDYFPEQAFGQPEGIIKTRENQYRAWRDAQAASPAVPTPKTPDISAILQIFGNTKPQNPQPQPQFQQAPDAGNPLAALLANISQNPQAQNPQTAAQPPAVAPYNLQAALAAITPAQQHNYQAQPTFGGAPANGVPNLQAILSQFNSQSAAPQAPPMQSYGFNPNQDPYPMNEDRKRQLENEENDYGRKKPRGGKPFTGTPHLPCKFWQEGKCRKGDECTFLH